MALRKAKEAETAYELSGKNRGPLDGINRELSQTVQRTVQEEVNLLRRHSGNDRFFSRSGNAFFFAIDPSENVIGGALIEGG
jgi:hypothetical protein